MDEHNEATLPKWAQERLDCLRRHTQQLEWDYQQLEQAHTVLFEHSWVPVYGPTKEGRATKLSPLDDERILFFLSGQGAWPAVHLYPGDVLLVGRDKERHPPTHIWTKAQEPLKSALEKGN